MILGAVLAVEQGWNFIMLEGKAIWPSLLLMARPYDR